LVKVIRPGNRGNHKAVAEAFDSDPPHFAYFPQSRHADNEGRKNKRHYQQQQEPQEELTNGFGDIVDGPNQSTILRTEHNIASQSSNHSKDQSHEDVYGKELALGRSR